MVGFDVRCLCFGFLSFGAVIIPPAVLECSCLDFHLYCLTTSYLLLKISYIQKSQNDL